MLVGGGRIRATRKIPIRTLAIVGDGIIRPRFLNQLHQYHPVNCQLVLRNSHDCTDEPALEQVKCRVQLQDLSTGLRNCLIDGRLTIEHIPNPSVGVSPFLFCPPDDPDAVR